MLPAVAVAVAVVEPTYDDFSATKHVALVAVVDFYRDCVCFFLNLVVWDNDDNDDSQPMMLGLCSFEFPKVAVA